MNEFIAKDRDHMMIESHTVTDSHENEKQTDKAHVHTGLKIKRKINK